MQGLTHDLIQAEEALRINIKPKLYSYKAGACRGKKQSKGWLKIFLGLLWLVDLVDEHMMAAECREKISLILQLLSLSQLMSCFLNISSLMSLLPIHLSLCSSSSSLSIKVPLIGLIFKGFGVLSRLVELSLKVGLSIQRDYNALPFGHLTRNDRFESSITAPTTIRVVRDYDGLEGCQWESSKARPTSIAWNKLRASMDFFWPNFKFNIELTNCSPISDDRFLYMEGLVGEI
uniref:Uncharacterized protein n=1 Tax=Cucumis melo TaxID=3656 RepID=A0A9I9E5A8_CUCME